MDVGGLLSPKEAAAELRIPQARFRRWMHRGIVPSTKDGGRYYIPAKAIERLLTEIASGNLKHLD